MKETDGSGMRGRSAPRVLLQTYFFPPARGAASVRTGWLYQVLIERGWSVIVQCAHPGPAEQQDGTVLRPVPQEHLLPRLGNVLLRPADHEGPVRGAAKLLDRFDPALPDPNLAWALRAAAQARALHLARPDLIVTSLPPYSTVLAGLAARRRLRAKWVLDLRDPWQTSPQYRLAGLRHRVGRRLETWALRRADGLVANTALAGEQLEAKLHALHHRCPLVVVSNGFEPARFVASPQQLPVDRPLTLVHTGALLCGDRDPEQLLAIIASLHQRGHLPAHGLRLVFSGSSAYMWSGRLQRLVDSSGLRRIVEIPGYLDHQENSRLIESADALLLLQQSPRYRTQIPSKAYEYLASGRPILCVSPPGATADLIIATRSGLVADPSVPGELENCLLRIFRRQVTVASGEERVRLCSPYDRTRLAERFVGFLERVMMDPSE